MRIRKKKKNERERDRNMIGKSERDGGRRKAQSLTRNK
jgi:hypothetical protein